MSKLVRVSNKVWKKLKHEERHGCGLKMGKQVEFHVFGKPAKIKRLGEM
jgi:hypothetical protein